MTVSLIISTYNRPDALELTLKGVLRQTRMPDEVIVGDDGSGAETKAVIERYKALFPVPLIHVWQEDKGFRLAEIRNKSIAAAKGKYIVQIDGDVIPSRHFIADHIAAARPGMYAKGSRVRLNEAYTHRLCESQRLPRFISPFCRGILKDREKCLRIPLLGSRLSHSYHNTGTGLGANLAFWRKDLIAVNGYDETFVGWGAEDTDLELRLQASGVKTFKLFRTGLVYHLWHKSDGADNPHYADAVAYLNAKLERGELRSRRGIDGHLSS